MLPQRGDHEMLRCYHAKGNDEHTVEISVFDILVGKKNRCIDFVM
jgi:hypothetical protein